MYVTRNVTAAAIAARLCIRRARTRIPRQSTRPPPTPIAKSNPPKRARPRVFYRGMLMMMFAAVIHLFGVHERRLVWQCCGR